MPKALYRSKTIIRLKHDGGREVVPNENQYETAFEPAVVKINRVVAPAGISLSGSMGIVVAELQATTIKNTKNGKTSVRSIVMQG